ncbi:MAG: thiolase family protein [Burkholderiales bacterium]|nr:MAG: thiolase family protein [Burkholderiales bacterium]
MPEPVRHAYVSGAGMTPFGRHPQRSLTGLGSMACLEALDDAGLAPADVQAAYCGSAMAALVQGESGLGQSVLWELGIHGIPVVNVENACATGATALHLAWRDVAWGVRDVVLAVGVDKAVMPKGSVLKAGTTQLEAQLGDVFPGLFALIAQKHMQAYGTTLRQMARVSVKNHDHGALNPLAQFNKRVTIEQVLESPMIAEPLTLFSCCPNSDGAAAAVICSERWLRDTRRDRVRIAASVLTSGDYDPMRDLTFWNSESRAVQQAYEASGLGPGDLDLVEVHDAFTISEILHCEAIGLCEPGGGGPLVESGATTLGGRIPVNPSGGLQARGHPPAASGLAQIFEIAVQLRGEAGPRQIAGARVGLAQIMGGSKGNDAQACAVHILVNDRLP